jgi:hypothetical protein
MTVVTRHAFPAAHSCSRVQFFARSASRSASIATSRPILFRNLKQSVTVFAGEIDAYRNAIDLMVLHGKDR